MKFSAVILAGGKSSRMGRDKAFIEIGGETLLARQIRIVRETGASEVFISGAPGKNYSAHGCKVLPDEFPDAGALAGIHAALRVAGSPLLFTLAVDLPVMTSDMLRILLEKSGSGAGAIPRWCGGMEPLTALYPQAALALCERCLREKHLAMRAFAARCVKEGFAQFVDLPPETGKYFLNLNSPDDFGLLKNVP